MVVCVGLTVAQSFAFRLLPTPGVIVMLVAFVHLPAQLGGLAGVDGRRVGHERHDLAGPAPPPR